MRIELKTVIVTLDGRPVDDPKGGDLTVCRAIVMALLIETSDDGDAKNRRFLLAEKITDAGGDVEVTIEEAGVIKEAIGRAMSPVVVGRVWRHMEGVAPAAQRGAASKRKKTGADS